MASGVFALGAALPAWMVDKFNPELRYTGISIAFNVAQAIFGGTAPAIATALYSSCNNVMLVAIFLVAIYVFALLSLQFPDTQQGFSKQVDEGQIVGSSRE